MRRWRAAHDRPYDRDDRHERPGQEGAAPKDRSGIAYIYTPAIPGNEVANTILDSVVQRLFRGRSNLALSHLLGLKRDLNPEQAAELRKYAAEHFVA